MSTSRALQNDPQQTTGVHSSDLTITITFYEGRMIALHLLLGPVPTALHCVA